MWCTVKLSDGKIASNVSRLVLSFLSPLTVASSFWFCSWVSHAEFNGLIVIFRGIYGISFIARSPDTVQRAKRINLIKPHYGFKPINMFLASHLQQEGFDKSVKKSWMVERSGSSCTWPASIHHLRCVTVETFRQFPNMCLSFTLDESTVPSIVARQKPYS